MVILYTEYSRTHGTNFSCMSSIQQLINFTTEHGVGNWQSGHLGGTVQFPKTLYSTLFCLCKEIIGLGYNLKLYLSQT